MTEEVKQEYLNLREEIQTNLETQRNLSTFSITTVITIIGFGMSMESMPPEFYLIPYLLLLLAAAKVKNLRNNIALLAGYMIARIEKPDGFFWETCLNEMRKEKRLNADRNDKKYGFMKRSSLKIDRFGERLETQEFTFMAVICLILFSYEAFIKGIHEMSIFLILWKVTAVAVCLLCIVLIHKWSNRYWNMDDKIIQCDRSKWIGIVGDIEKNVQK